jgi:hypothetical protein
VPAAVKYGKAKLNYLRNSICSMCNEDAKLMGVEFILTAELFDTFPGEE